MDRLPSRGYVTVIAQAKKIVESRLPGLALCDFLCDTDPIFVGLHGFVDDSYGRSYRDTAHCVYPFHQIGVPKSRRRTTVVLPVVPSVECVVHELGHVLDFELGFQHKSNPLNTYAGTDNREAFAEAFTAWLIPGYWSTSGVQDKNTNEFLNSLASRTDG